MSKTFKPKRGSVLVFSLIVLSILLSAAVAVALTSVSNTRSVFSTSKSNQSFQVADSGAEIVLQQIYKTTPTHVSLNALATTLGGGAACVGGAITKSGVAGGDIKVSFYDKDDNLINCADAAWRSKVVAIKSEGTASGTTRLVETAVAAGSCIDWVSVPAANGVRNQPGGCRDGYITYSPPRSPTDICQAAGFKISVGACKTDPTCPPLDWEPVEGALMYTDSSVINASYLTCAYNQQGAVGGVYRYFDLTPNSMILCSKC